MTNEEVISLFENGITREGLKSIFNPYSIMKSLKNHFFSQEILYELERNASYEELKVSVPYCTYFGNDKDNLFFDAIKTFLSYKDNMPFFPTVDDWVKEISAPVEVINKIIPNDGVSLSLIFGNQFYAYQLRNIFCKKINKMEELEDDNYEEGKFEFTENYFDDYFSDRLSSTIKTQWEKYLSKEFKVAERLEEAWNNHEQYFKIAKEKHQSVNDTIMLFVDYAFEEYDEMISED